MRPEIIVAKIEEYVNSLSKEGRESYDGVMAIKTKHPEESVKILSTALAVPILNLAIIVDELKQEIKEASIKQSKGGNTLQRIKKINKFLSDKNITRQEMKKAWMENDKMCISNCYIGFMFNDVLDDVSIGEQSYLKLEKCFPDERDYKETVLDIVDVKSQLKLHKAKETGKKTTDKTTCQYIIDGHYYNAVFLIDAYEILGGNIIFKQGDNVLMPAVMESENGKAGVLPIKPPKENE